MFTGIVEEMGVVRSVRDHGTDRDLVIDARFSGELRVDQSIAHNGVCLTVVEVLSDPVRMSATGYRVTAVKETLDRSNLADLAVGDAVNLERCLRIGDRLDGHMVQGHVDTTVLCSGVEDLDGSWGLTFGLPQDKELLVQKGSVCLNGVSLTVASLDERSFGVVIIPYTHAHTTFRTLRTGDRVNIEFDVLGKYVKRMLER